VAHVTVIYFLTNLSFFINLGMRFLERGRIVTPPVLL
jgi:hypothetical protein